MVHNTKYIIAIFVCSFLFLFLLIANPGYFSHDELQRYDYFARHGFFAYLDAHLKIYGGDSFGTPVRPFSFLIQGLQNFFIRDYPVFVHLSAVLVHALAASLLFIACIQFGLEKPTALISALIFLLNPLTVLATGWSAALMDQWYFLFGLLSLIFANEFIEDKNGGHLKLLAVFAFSSLSVLSKETAVVLPALLAVILLRDVRKIKTKRFWLTAIAWTLPVLLFVSLRLAAIKSSFNANIGDPYAASISNIPENVFVYFLYPFYPSLTEAGNWIFSSKTLLTLAFIFHLFLVFITWRILSVKAAIGYLAGYFLFLLPVLFIPMKGSHYLYGSAAVLSILIAVLVNSKIHGVYRLLGVFSLVLLALHSAKFQVHVYKVGACMDRLMDSAESLYLSSGRPHSMEFRSEPGAPGHVLYRFITGRDQIGAYYPIKFSVAEWDAPPPEDTLSVIMNSECIAFKK